MPQQWDQVSELPLLVLLEGRPFINPNSKVGAWAIWDNLIEQKKIPPFFAIVANPGKQGAAVEYLGADDRTSTFLLDELIPEAVVKFKLKISNDRRQRAIGGFGQGAYSALKVAF